MRASQTTGLESTKRARPPKIILRVEAVEALLNASGWTVAELARRMGLDQSAVHRLLRRKMQLGAHSIAGLLWAFREPYEGRIGFHDLFILDGNDAPDEVVS